MAVHLHPEAAGAKVLTKVKLIAVDGTETLEELELANKPTYDALKAIIDPFISGTRDPPYWFERVAVLDNFGDGKMRPLDMFVDENGLVKHLPRNEKATTIYRRANLCGMTAVAPVANPEMLNFIVGPAVLFNRPVWF